MRFNILKKIRGSGSSPLRSRFAYIAWTNDIVKFPKADYRGVALMDDIKMRENTGMMQIYLTSPSQEYSYETIGDPDSKIFKVKFTGTHPGTEQEALEFAKNFLEESFIVLIPSCEAGVKVLGTPDAPLIFTSSHKSEKAGDKFIFNFEQEIGSEVVYQLYTGVITLNQNIEVDMDDFLEQLKNYMKLDGTNLTEAQKENMRTILGIQNSNIGNSDLSLSENRSFNLKNYVFNFFSNVGLAKIGFNKNNPSEVVDVSGNVKTDGLILNEGLAENKLGLLSRIGNNVYLQTDLGKIKLLKSGDLVTDDHGIIYPDTPTPVTGWVKGWYTPGISSVEGTSYPNLTPAKDESGNATILKKVEGYETSFYYNGTYWVRVSEKMPAATPYIPNFSTSTFPLNGYVQRFYNGVIWELPNGEISTINDVPGVSSKWKQVIEGNSQLGKSIGVNEVVIGTNFISELVGSDLNNPDLWSVGYLNRNTPPATTVQTFRFSKKYYPINPGTYEFRLAIYGNAVICFYDEAKNIVGYLEKGDSNASIIIKTADVPANALYVRISHFYGNGTLDGSAAGGHPTTSIYIKNNSKLYTPTENIFVLNAKFPEKTNAILKDSYGVNMVAKNTESLTLYIGSSVSDTALWEPGFLRSTGAVELGANWYHSKNYIRIPAGTYSYRFYYAGNARAILYNLQTKAIEQTLSNSTSTDGHNGTFTINKDMWLRFSHRENATEPTRINQITVKNTADITPVIVSSFNVQDFIPAGSNTSLRQAYKDTYTPKRRRKIATFICDDGHINDKLWYLPLLAEYGIKSTLAISKHWAISGDSNRLTESDIIQYHKDGHDIANHTVSHLYFTPASPAPPMPLDQAETEILDNKLYLEDLINDEVPMFISPFGMRNANIDYLVSKYHKANFISGYAVNNPTPLSSYFINRVSFDVGATGQLIFDTKIKPAIDEAGVNNQWLVFAVHSGYAEYEITNTVNRRQELRQTIEYLIANGFEIMTARRAFDFWRNPVELGVKGYSTKYYALGMDGAETNLNYFTE